MQRKMIFFLLFLPTVFFSRACSGMNSKCAYCEGSLALSKSPCYVLCTPCYEMVLSFAENSLKAGRTARIMFYDQKELQKNPQNLKLLPQFQFNGREVIRVDLFESSQNSLGNNSPNSGDRTQESLEAWFQ